MATWQEALDHAQTETEHDTWDHTGLTGVSGTPAFVGARVYNSANISIATSGTSQALTFNSERYDTDSIHDIGSNTSRLTIPSDGTYLITAHVQFGASATGARGLGIRLGGSTNIAWHTQPAAASGTTIVSLSTVYQFTATQYVELMAFQTSGGALNAEASADRSPEFTISKLG